MFNKALKFNYKVINDLLILLCIFSLPCLFIVFASPFYSFSMVDKLFDKGIMSFFYFFIFLFLLTLMFYKNNKKFDKLFLFFCLLLFSNMFFRFLNIDSKSTDYTFFLKEWVESYRELSIKECFYIKVGNYSPPYNYFLILFSRININSLYLIKTLSFVFELLSAYFITDLVSYISKKKFNIWIFLFVLSIPIFLINSSVWAQCDSIYSFFSFMAIYFAIKRKSKLSFVFFGLSVCFKFQAIILFPVALVLLLCKDTEGRKILKWKDLYFAPLSYLLLTGVSMLFGKSFKDAFLIYFEQSITYNSLSSGCSNLAYIFNFLNEYELVKFIVMILLIILTILVLVIILKKFICYKNLSDYMIVYVSFLVTFCVVLFMPKMLDRYFYLSNMFAVCLLLMGVKKDLICVLLINLVSSFVVHVCFTCYYGYSNDYLLAYSIHVVAFVASIVNSIGGIYLFLNKDEELLNCKV